MSEIFAIMCYDTRNIFGPKDVLEAFDVEIHDRMLKDSI
jgi:hypothetical protein